MPGIIGRASASGYRPSASSVACAPEEAGSGEYRLARRDHNCTYSETPLETTRCLNKTKPLHMFVLFEPSRLHSR